MVIADALGGKWVSRAISPALEPDRRVFDPKWSMRTSPQSPSQNDESNCNILSGTFQGRRVLVTDSFDLSHQTSGKVELYMVQAFRPPTIVHA